LSRNKKAEAHLDRTLKKSVAAVYETDTFNSFLKDGLHPGGMALTRRVARVARLDRCSRVLDIACGKGGTPLLLAQEIECSVVGVDLSEKKIVLARDRSHAENSNGSLEFIVADAEELPFLDATFDAIISECSFSVLPNKEKAAQEMSRVLKPRGRLVITDIVTEGRMPDGIHRDLSLAQGSFPLLPCIAGAMSTEEYVATFEDAGLHQPFIEDRSIALKKLGYQIGINYGGWEGFLQGLSSELFPDADAKGIAEVRAYQTLLAQGKFGYALLMFSKNISGRANG
jgi:ubiquinone/menaquinone biosynthesis C-methylase UbiE